MKLQIDPRVLSSLRDIEELHRRFIDADAKAVTAREELLFAQELEKEGDLVRLRMNYLVALAVSQAAWDPYFSVICSLLNALPDVATSNRAQPQCSDLFP